VPKKHGWMRLCDVATGDTAGVFKFEDVDPLEELVKVLSLPGGRIACSELNEVSIFLAISGSGVRRASGGLDVRRTGKMRFGGGSDPSSLENDEAL